MAFTIKRETSKLTALIKRMQQLDGTVVEDGFFEEDRYGPENFNFPVAFVAYMNEYGHSVGVQAVPDRPFMHDTYESKNNQFHMARAMKKVFQAAMTDGRSVDRLLKGVGQMIAEMLEAQIETYAAAGGNSPTTIKRKKGRDTPLRDTDKMLNSVRFRIHKGGMKDA